jgi:uncharacterized integral membrane protein (TIGR00697 family)
MALLKPTDMKFTLMSMLYGAMLVLGPILSNRIVDVFGFKIMLGAVLIVMALGLLDVINNDFGLKKARDVVVSSLVIRLILWCVIAGLLLLPTVQETSGYQQMVHTSFQIVLAGELSMFVSQYFVDTRIFHWVKSRFSYFPVRYVVSNLASFTIGSAIFLPIAFWGRPGISLMALFWGHLAARLLIQLIMLPVWTVVAHRSRN